MAVGDTLLVFDPLANHPPASNFATLDMRGDFVVLDFDGSANEKAQFHAVLPSHYKGANLELAITWTSTSATTGNAKLRAELTRIAAGTNLDSLPSPHATADITAGAPSTSGMLMTSEFGPLTISSLVAGDVLRVQLTRLASDAADTMSGDLEFVGLEVKEVA